MSEWRILVGDVRASLATVETGSVQTCVTSPPYWGLRDYGTASWDGGDPACDHIEHRQARRDSPGGYHNSRNDRSGATQPSTQASVMPFRDVCGLCGARRVDSQIGLEATPDAYVAQMVAVFRLVRTALKDDGTLWLNLGDSYNSNCDMTRNDEKAAKGLREQPRKQRPAISGLKTKDLCGVPWSVAFALRADGWYLRSDIIWSKPNPMPESVTDRPTKAHEYMFLLSKSARYLYDADAIREPLEAWAEINGQMRNIKGGQGYAVDRRAEIYPGMAGKQLPGNMAPGKHITPNPAGRNKRSVWHVATQPYAEAHFATFPEDLILPCILAGSRPGDLVLDPFAGSGTTGAVSVRHQRNFIGCELNPAYVELARKRIGAVAPLFAEERTA